MAITIPDYRRQVGPAGAPIIRAAVPSADAEGSAIGQTVAQIGFQEAEKRDRAAALSFARSAQQQVDDVWYGEGGGRWKDGQAYREWATADPVAALRKGWDEGLNELSPRAREHAGLIVNDLEDGLNRSIMQRAGQALATEATGNYRANIEGTRTSTMLRAADPEKGLTALDDGLEIGGQLIGGYLADNGHLIQIGKTEWAKAEVQTFESNLVDSSIRQALAAGQTDLAEQMLAVHGEKLLPDAAPGIVKAVGEASRLGNIANVWEEAIAQYPIEVGNPDAPPPHEQVASIERYYRGYGKIKGWNQGQIEEAVDYARHRSEQTIRDGQLKQAETFDALDTALAESRGDLLHLMQTRPQEYAGLAQGQRDLLHERAAAERNGIAKADAELRYSELLSAATSDDEDLRASFGRYPLMRDPTLAALPSLRDELVKLQESITKHEYELVEDFRSEKERVDAKISALGYHPEPSAEDEDAVRFRTQYALDKATLARNLERAPTDPEINELLDRMTSEEFLSPDQEPIDLGDPLFEAEGDIDDIPPERVAQISLALRGRGLPADEDTIVAEWMTWLRSGLPTPGGPPLPLEDDEIVLDAWASLGSTGQRRVQAAMALHESRARAAAPKPKLKGSYKDFRNRVKGF